jgi:hypothetical protein
MFVDLLVERVFLILGYCALLDYRKFIASPTLNNSKKKVDFFWKLSLNVVEIL